jgi:hypothetical protein
MSRATVTAERVALAAGRHPTAPEETADWTCVTRRDGRDNTGIATQDAIISLPRRALTSCYEAPGRFWGGAEAGDARRSGIMRRVWCVVPPSLAMRCNASLPAYHLSRVSLTLGRSERERVERWIACGSDACIRCTEALIRTDRSALV